MINMQRRVHWPNTDGIGFCTRVPYLPLCVRRIIQMRTSCEFPATLPGSNKKLNQRFLQEKLLELDHSRTTVDELIHRAKNDGWIGFLGELPCLTLRKLLTKADQNGPVAPINNPSSGISKTRRVILNFVFDNPWNPVEEIASSLCLPQEVVAKELHAFRSKQLLRTREENGTTLYAPVV